MQVLPMVVYIKYVSLNFDLQKSECKHSSLNNSQENTGEKNICTEKLQGTIKIGRNSGKDFCISHSFIKFHLKKSVQSIKL